VRYCCTGPRRDEREYHWRFEKDRRNLELKIQYFMLHESKDIQQKQNNRVNE